MNIETNTSKLETKLLKVASLVINNKTSILSFLCSALLFSGCSDDPSESDKQAGLQQQSIEYANSAERSPSRSQPYSHSEVQAIQQDDDVYLTPDLFGVRSTNLKIFKDQVIPFILPSEIKGPSAVILDFELEKRNDINFILEYMGKVYSPKIKDNNPNLAEITVFTNGKDTAMSISNNGNNIILKRFNFYSLTDK